MILKPLIVLLCLAAVCARQTVREAAHFARQVVSDAGVGTFLTHMHDTLEGEGYPFGIMEYYSGDCTDHPGDLLLYMSELQMSVRNMHHNPDRVAFTVRALRVYDNPKMGNGSSIVELPRLTLFGAMEPVPASKFESAMECYGEKHPDAKAWRGFHDFHFYTLRVRAIYYVGGFGGLNYIGYLPMAEYRQATSPGLHVQNVGSIGGSEVTDRL